MITTTTTTTIGHHKVHVRACNFLSLGLAAGSSLGLAAVAAVAADEAAADEAAARRRRRRRRRASHARRRRRRRGGHRRGAEGVARDGVRVAIGMASLGMSIDFILYSYNLQPLSQPLFTTAFDRPLSHPGVHTLAFTPWR